MTFPLVIASFSITQSDDSSLHFYFFFLTVSWFMSLSVLFSVSICIVHLSISHYYDDWDFLFMTFRSTNAIVYHPCDSMIIQHITYYQCYQWCVVWWCSLSFLSEYIDICFVHDEFVIIIAKLCMTIDVYLCVLCAFLSHLIVLTI